ARGRLDHFKPEAHRCPHGAADAPFSAGGSGTVMSSYMIEHVRPILLHLSKDGVWLMITAAIFVPIERLFALHDQKLFRKEIAVDVGYYFLNGLVVAFVLAIPLSVIALIARHVVPMSVIWTLTAWPLWLRACAALVIGEIGYYWGHRLTHQI